MDGQSYDGAKDVLDGLSTNWETLISLTEAKCPEDLNENELNQLRQISNASIVKKNEKNGLRFTETGKEFLDIMQLLVAWTEENATTDRTPKITIIEDDDIMAQMFERWLSDAFDIEITRSRSYMNEIDESTDVIVIERFLNSTESTEVIKEVKKNWPDKPILILIGVDPKIEDVDPGADDYIVKPVTRKEFIKKIRTLVED